MEKWLPLVKDGCYHNPWPSGQAERGFRDILKWKLQCGPKRPSWESMQKMVPTAPCNAELLRNPTAQGVAPGSVICTWIGHATYLIQVDGLSVLTDPIWSDRCSMVQFAGPQRLVAPPLPISELPNVDVVSVSHNHYDHLDTNTIEQLAAKFDPFFIVPIGMKSQWFAGVKAIKDPNRVIELNWWDNHVVKVNRTSFDGSEGGECCSISITAVPAQHWSYRAPCNRNKQLWCGFVYDFSTSGTISRAAAAKEDQLPFRRVYHAGDTAYCEAFAQIGRNFGPLDVSMIPIGAYEPRWFMQSQHANPDDAAQIHVDVRSKHSLGMHWGTFVLTDEPVDEPPKALRRALEARGIDEARFRTLPIGGSATF